MELRFLHGDFGNIKYKLQYLRHDMGAMRIGSMWEDVPVVESIYGTKNYPPFFNCPPIEPPKKQEKDELVERLKNAYYDKDYVHKTWESVAEVARKWAVEVVKEWHKGDQKIGLGVENLILKFKVGDK